ncbi:hypothetical protein PENTCL1PPCAC_4501, partial [Pristionchus entomophagus]
PPKLFPLQQPNMAPTTLHFDPNDPKYTSCCCCCKSHVSSLAKLLLCIFLFITTAVAAVAIKEHIWLLVPIPVLIGIILALAAFRDNRTCLLFIVVALGLGITALVGFILALLLAFVVNKVHADNTNIYAASIVLAAVAAVLLAWMFKVLHSFYKFLRDQERAGAVPCVFEMRLPPAETEADPYGQSEEWTAARTKATAHLASPRDRPATSTGSAGSGNPAPGSSAPPVYPVLEQTENREFGWRTD